MIVRSRIFDEAIRLAPDNALAFTNRCMTRATIGQLESALADCNRALDLRPNDGIALVWRGLVHLKMGRHDAALADEDASLSIDPKGATALYLRGIVFRRKGDEAHARADIAAALAINPKVSAEITSAGSSRVEVWLREAWEHRRAPSYYNFARPDFNLAPL